MPLSLPFAILITKSKKEILLSFEQLILKRLCKVKVCIRKERKSKKCPVQSKAAHASRKMDVQKKNAALRVYVYSLFYLVKPCLCKYHYVFLFTLQIIFDTLSKST